MPVELPEPLDVIAVGAHPDDVEIAVGGTLAMLVRQGYRVGIVDLTLGSADSDPGVGDDPATIEDGARGRVAFFYKGSIRNGIVLTTAYDSDGRLMERKGVDLA